MITEPEASEILSHIAKHDPGILFDIINEATSGKEREIGLSTLSPIRAGHLLRKAMGCISTGLGVLAQYVAPIGHDGSVMTVATARKDNQLMVGWTNQPSESGVAQLPISNPIEMFSLDHLKYPYGCRAAAPIGHALWAWSWVADYFRGKLKSFVSRDNLPVHAGPMSRELAWGTAISLLRLHHNHSLPIDINSILSILPLEQLSDRLKKGWRTRILHGGRSIDVSHLVNVLIEEKDRGAMFMEPCLPLEDRIRTVPPQYLYFSDEQLVFRMNRVMSYAIEEYSIIVERYFGAFRDRLDHFAILPAKISGTVRWNSYDPTKYRFPIVSLTCEALPKGRETEISFEMTDGQDSVPGFMNQEVRRRLEESVVQHRPDLGHFLIAHSYVGMADAYLTDTAITDTVLGWLRQDLSRIDWM